MPKMNVMDAVVRVMESEGVDVVFGVPGAAILPLYKALSTSSIRHGSVRHEEGGTHAADGYARVTGKGRRQHRHERPGRHEHDHRPLHRDGRLHPDDLHHRAGADRRAPQGGLPGGRHRRDRQAGDEVEERRVPVLVEIMTERDTDAAMGVAIDAINEYEPIVDGLAERAGQVVGALPERD
jgi:glyoxylate carboligase